MSLSEPPSVASILGPMAGVRVLESEHLVIREQVRFPRSKRKRIRKKWAKRPENWAERPDPDIYRMADPITGRVQLVCHPETARRLREMIDAKG